MRNIKSFINKENLELTKETKIGFNPLVKFTDDKYNYEVLEKQSTRTVTINGVQGSKAGYRLTIKDGLIPVKEVLVKTQKEVIETINQFKGDK